MIFLWIVVSLLIFSIIVIVHEYGHYKAAKMCNIHVEEFGLWIPPRAKELWRSEDGTLFSLNWIPLGWFVRLSWESEISLEYYGKNGKLLSLAGLRKKIKNHDDIFDKKWDKIHKSERKYISMRLENYRPWENFYEKNIFAKSFVLLAGVMMNFLLAGVIFSFLFWIWVKPVGINTVIETSVPSQLIPTLDGALESWLIKEWEWILLYPIEWSLAQKSWIQNADILLRVDEQSFEEISDLQAYISSKASEDISLYIERKTLCSEDDSEKENCPIIEYLDVGITPSSEGLIGTYLSPNYTISQDFIYKYPLWGSIKYGFFETYSQARLTLSGLKMLGKSIFFPESPTDRQEAIDQVAGPVGIVAVVTQSLQWWVILLLVLGAVISVNLWVFNLLPIPALDWGRLLLLWIRTAIDKIFGKSALSWNIENSIHLIFFLILIVLSIFIAYNDISKLL